MLWDGQLLLGKHTNKPLKGEWFTHGGQIHKNETWQGALLRIAKVELGLSGIAVDDFALMDMWDHFYNNSALDQNTSTHYLNLPHYAEFKYNPQIALDDQHAEFEWFDLAVLSSDENFNPYIRNYAGWLLNKIGDTDD